ncbi:peptide chain release factor 2 [Thermosporothrix hazakensis]|jgi:peptide chain release factor 2|uniref:Peptide chain release factor 2 n=3 Tax=Thermosporothrix TaxID=768650 RepID=A0A326UNN9_THEHA|nr:peptide chain release factor 2 [Thermosporothrix hazakensis]BBH88407.1 peptide chain release factor 2 [Thermosporothrix sp. COM3]GCE46594.1 peptide chain release factor 2 [Thermosporothrix hazakensis]
MQRLNALREEVNTWEGIATQLQDLQGLAELLEEEPDDEVRTEVEQSLNALEQQIEQLEFALMLSGEHDEKNAILSIHAGSGGVDAQDWAEMLLRMYLRWAEKHHFRTQVYDYSEGEEAGVKSVTVEIEGRYAYGYLRSEAGTHRLIRLSPFDAAHRRHTSFAKVEVMPDIEDAIEIVIRPEDLEVDTFRSTGAGGQHVNKTDSAVRMRHIPTGIVVTCQNERSQIQNREVALKLLRARLYELELKKREEETARLKGAHVEADFGTQIRSVIVHPYNIVKDHRTGYETSDTSGYLAGDIDPFIHAYLQEKASGLESSPA